MDTIFQSTLYTAFRIDEDNISDYLQCVTNLLAQYSWIYSYRNIDIFISDVLEKIPSDWVEELSVVSPEELSKLPFGYQKERWPSSLKSFIAECTKLGSCRFANEKLQAVVSKNRSNLLKNMPEQKQFEVKILSRLIKEVCQSMECNTVIDVGSGLGYLDQALHCDFGLFCIGLDAVPKYTLSAIERLKSGACKNSVLHKTHKVKYSDDCLHDFKAILEESRKLRCICIKGNDNTEKQPGSVIMASLHSCGNLSQDMMKLFCELDDIIAFVCIGCCYNKIDLSDFPMSNTAKHSVKSTQTIYPLWYPSISGLRLASHGTRSDPRTFPITHEREYNLFYRALLEYYVKKENIVWKQPKRHIRSSDLENFNSYCSKMFKDHVLDGDKKVLNALNTLYQEKLKIFHRIKILLVLQMMLQPLWEAFVVLDRVMYFKERNIFVEVLEMWGDSVSPRNLALCAYKR